MRPDQLWEGTSAKARTVRTLLKPLSWLYGCGWQVYLGSYAIGVKKSTEPHRAVFCVGSLTVGGSGKSPLTMHIVKVLQSIGKDVVIGCSGYGAPHSKDANLAPDGPLSAAEWGDEPSMVRWFLPEVPLVVGRNRVLAAQLVHERYPDSVLLMDDGFQHLPLKKHTTLIIDDPDARNRSCMPAGPYREPWRNRKRADMIVPGEFRIIREPMRIVDFEGREIVPTQYAILCALGQPAKFVEALTAQFPNMLPNPPTVLLPDHDPLIAADLWSSIPSGLPVVVTAKDWVKLRDRKDLKDRGILIALQEVRLEPHEDFKRWVERRFNE